MAVFHQERGHRRPLADARGGRAGDAGGRGAVALQLRGDEQRRLLHVPPGRWPAPRLGAVLRLCHAPEYRDCHDGRPGRSRRCNLTRRQISALHEDRSPRRGPDAGRKIPVTVPLESPAMTRLVPILLLTALAVYVVWSDATSTEPVGQLTWLIDIVIVALAAWSWISFLTRKRPEADRED